jgi:hypothetical protein
MHRSTHKKTLQNTVRLRIYLVIRGRTVGQFVRYLIKRSQLKLVQKHLHRVLKSYFLEMLPSVPVFDKVPYTRHENSIFPKILDQGNKFYFGGMTTHDTGFE